MDCQYMNGLCIRAVGLCFGISGQIILFGFTMYKLRSIF